MKRIMWKQLIMVLVALLVLASCKEKATPEATTAPTVAPTAPSTTAPTSDDGQEGPVAPPTVGDPSEPVEVSAPEEAGFCEAAPLPVLPVRPVDDTDWVKGAAEEDAEITIYEYSDFQCPGCAGMYPVLQAFIDDNPNVRLVYRHFPLDFHELAPITSEATEAAGAQGKFWEMHNLLFDNAQEWGALSLTDIRAKLSEYAEMLDLDVDQFDTALDALVFQTVDLPQPDTEKLAESQIVDRPADNKEIIAIPVCSRKKLNYIAFMGHANCFLDRISISRNSDRCWKLELNRYDSIARGDRNSICFRAYGRHNVGVEPFLSPVAFVRVSNYINNCPDFINALR